MAFSSGSRPGVGSLVAGDEFFLYATRNAFRNPTRARGRVIGTARLTSQVAAMEEPVRFRGREYPIGCSLELGPLAPFGHGVELAPLVPQLEAFDGAGIAWRIRLRRALLRVTDHDSTLLHRALDDVLKPDDANNDTVAAYARWFVP